MEIIRKAKKAIPKNLKASGVEDLSFLINDSFYLLNRPFKVNPGLILPRIKSGLSILNSTKNES